MKENMLTAFVVSVLTVSVYLPRSACFNIDENGFTYDPKLCKATTPSGCYNPDTGYDKMILGIDITELDLFPMEATQPQGFRKPVVSATCLKGTGVVLPDDTVIQRPSELKEVIKINTGSSVATTTFVRSASDVMKFFEVQVSASGSSPMGSFSMSVSAGYKQLERTITERQKSVQYVSVTNIVKELVFKDAQYLTLDSFTQMVFDKLPDTYRSNKAAYEDFIRDYGTHYFNSAIFGGKVLQYQETTKDYAYRKNKKDFTLEAEATFYARVKVSTKISGGKAEENERFKSSTISSLRYYGGNTNLLAKDGLKSWSGSLRGDPWLLKGTLVKISELVHGDDKRKGELSIAIDEYVMRHSLKEYFRLINRALAKANHVMLTSFIQKIRKLEKKDIIDAEAAKVLAKEIDYQMNVPSWFYETQFCMKLEKGGSKKLECKFVDGTTETCAPVNTKTVEYVDDTNDLKSGCKMQWKIKSENQESWFDKVFLCFFLEGYTHAQCGGNGLQHGVEHCVKLNIFTKEYLDLTGKAARGGCEYSWALKIPENSPLWLQRTKLCFFSTARGDGSQCGYATDMQCAMADNYTPAYKDQTGDKDGGCGMSWGLYTGL